jgi:hypothetical protein
MSNGNEDRTVVKPAAVKISACALGPDIASREDIESSLTVNVGKFAVVLNYIEEDTTTTSFLKIVAFSSSLTSFFRIP